MYITLQDLEIISLHVVSQNMIILEWYASGMWLVLVRIVPSCPNAHSRLILLIPSAYLTVYRCPHSLPRGAVWLGCPDLGAWLRVFSSTCVHTSP